MSQPASHDFARDESGSRLVWVLNLDPKYDYKGTFEGAAVVIPARSQKIPKPHHQGGNLMSHVAARQFITDYKEPQEWVMDKAGRPQPVFRPKMLYEEELTHEEFATIVKKTPKEIKLKIASEEKEARKKMKEEVAKKSTAQLIVEDDEV